VSIALEVRRPEGPIRWADGLDLQRSAHEARRGGSGPDTLFLLQHHPVVTLGPRTEDGDLVVPEERLAERGIDVHRTDRGGGITYHGPGQVVAYPVLDLRAWDLRPRDYLRWLEGLVAELLGRWGLDARTIEGRTGLWVDDAKVCALGVRVAGGVSLHGLALNVTTDLKAFEAIVPCGIRDAGVTSLDRLLDVPPTTTEVMDGLEELFLREAARRNA
jgi:lipoyl(octanoyl) transferase